MRKIVLVLIVFLLIPVFIGCNGRIEGYVYKTDERAAVEDSGVLNHVTITLDVIGTLNPTISPPGSEYSRSNGYYSIEGLTPGFYNITFTPQETGSRSYTYDNIEVTSNITTPLSVKLEIPTTPAIGIAGSYEVDGSTLPAKCTVLISVSNPGDCPLYLVVASATLYQDTGNLIYLGTGSKTITTPIAVDSTSNVTFDIYTSTTTVKSGVYTVSYSTTATPTHWSIKQ